MGGRWDGLERANEGIWVVDRSGRTEFVNRRMADMLLCGPEDLIGRAAFDCVPEEDQAASRARFNKRLSALDGERYEVRLRRADGSVIWAEVSSSALLDEQGNATGR